MSAESPGPGPSWPEPTAPRDLRPLNAYVAEYYGRYTDAALSDHLMKIGHERADIEAALRAAAAADRIGPLNARARLTVRLSYLITYGLLVAGMLISKQSDRYGAGAVGVVVLTVVLGLAFLLAAVWLRRRGSRNRPVPADMTALLSVPLILLVLVAGSCLATGLPLPGA